MSKRPLILVVDDTETNIDIVLDILSPQDYDIMVSLDGQSALESLDNHSVDLVLLDIMMPNMSGFEVCQRIKCNKKTKDIPVIFITALDDEDSIEKAFTMGGVDYITKPFKPKELTMRVMTQLKHKSLVSSLEHLSYYDSLTNIYNRRRFFELGRETFKKSSKNLFVAMLDLDNFKMINDTYGHKVGDMVICRCAKTISQLTPKGAIFARIGGEEFALVYSSKSEEESLFFLESVRKEIEKSSIMLEEDQLKYTISIGVCENNSSIENFDELLQEADFALYKAKNSGKNMVTQRVL